MKLFNKILLGLLFFSNLTFGQIYSVPNIPEPSDYNSITYIDPDWGGTESGTELEPYSDFSNAPLQYNTAYLIKANSTTHTNLNVNGASKIYIGKWGVGDFPSIDNTGVIFTILNSSNVVLDSLELTRQGGSSYGAVINIQSATIDSLTIANCKIYGQDDGGYPYYLQQGMGSNFTLYHCEYSYCRNDGIYSGGGNNLTIVSNYFHHQSMDNIYPASIGTGDGIQFEGGTLTNGYIANNFMDRHHTTRKFALIINAIGGESARGLIVEWNTFVSSDTSAGGSGVRWYTGQESMLRKNLFNTYTGIPGVDGWSAYLNLSVPYGMRDNHEFGPGDICNQSLDDATNLDFNSESAYLTYLSDNELTAYGSDIDTSNYWLPTNPTFCQLNSIDITGIVVDDTNTLGVGSIDITVTGGSGTGRTYLWNGGTTSEDTTGLYLGDYSVMVTDDSSCTESYYATIENKLVIGGDFVTDTVIDNFDSYTAATLLSTTDDWTDFLNDLLINDFGGGDNKVGASETQEINIVYNDSTYGVNQNISINLSVRQSASDQGIVGRLNTTDSSYYAYIGKRYESQLIKYTPATGRVRLGNLGNSWLDGYVYTLDISNDTIRAYRDGILATDVGVGGTGMYVDPSPLAEGYAGIFVLSDFTRLDTFNAIFSYETEVLTYPLTATPSLSHVDCYGDSTGSISVSVSNGLAPYAHSWNIDSTNASISNLPAGTYTDTIRDANDSILISTYIIAQYDSIFYKVEANNPTNGLDNGSILIYNVTGGSGLCDILWNDNSTSYILESLYPGDYWAIITDNLECNTDTIRTTLFNSTLDTILVGVDTTTGMWANKINQAINEYNIRTSSSLERVQVGRIETYSIWCTKVNIFRNSFPSIITDSLNYRTDKLGIFRNQSNEVIYLEGITY